MKQGESKIMEASQSTISYELLAFGIARDIVGGSMVKVGVAGKQTVGQLKAVLRKKYPDFERLKSLAIAVNEEYREDDFELNAADEIVIIPPVSGG